MLRAAQRRALIGRATQGVVHFAPTRFTRPTVLSQRAQSTASGDKEGITAAVAAWRKAPTAPLRFPVGAPVRCLVAGGAWATGRVVKHNHREAGAAACLRCMCSARDRAHMHAVPMHSHRDAGGGIQPYQIQIDAEHARGEQNAVWAPADIDECIRAALRFGVGDTVECCVNPGLGLWVRGKVSCYHPAYPPRP